ncbi:MAG TPA: hypothetical protein VFY61_02865 [Pyrinomonadaceae bacterium]|nr:hypothetical protein [Pyrinomonadaceae bacterium]
MRTVGLFLMLSAASWQTIDFNGLFTFRLPGGFEKREGTKPDDLRVEYRKGQTILVVVWGHTESVAYEQRRQDWMHDYHESMTRIRGLRANIRRYSQGTGSRRAYRAELNVGNWEKGEVQLYMRMETDDPAMLEVAEQIFKSVNLPLPPPERP